MPVFGAIPYDSTAIGLPTANGRASPASPQQQVSRRYHAVACNGGSVEERQETVDAVRRQLPVRSGRRERWEFYPDPMQNRESIVWRCRIRGCFLAIPSWGKAPGLPRADRCFRCFLSRQWKGLYNSDRRPPISTRGEVAAHASQKFSGQRHQVGREIRDLIPDSSAGRATDCQVGSITG